MECCEIEYSRTPVLKPEQLNDYSRRLYEDLVSLDLSREEVVYFLKQENLSGRLCLYYMVVTKASKAHGDLRNDQLASLLLGDRQFWDVTDQQGLPLPPHYYQSRTSLEQLQRRKITFCPCFLPWRDTLCP
jgi:hypothetical protein